jgi:hypothetical protein
MSWLVAKAAKAAGALRSGPEKPGHVMRTVDKAIRRGLAHRLSRRDADNQVTSNNNTLNDMMHFQNKSTSDGSWIYENFTSTNINFTSIHR